MMVEESRILQVTIFHTLQENLGVLDFSVLMKGIMTIADEVDSQLSQAMKSFTFEMESLPIPVWKQAAPESGQDANGVVAP